MLNSAKRFFRFIICLCFVFLNKSESSTNEFIASMVKDVQKFVGKAQQSDDITLLLLKKV